MSKSIKEQLSNVFINEMGNVEARKKHKIEINRIRDKLRELRLKEYELEQRIKTLESESFNKKNNLNSELRTIRKTIQRFKRKYLNLRK